MTAWYERHDWIVLGGTAAGRVAAGRAAQAGRRVALVEPMAGETRPWAEALVNQGAALATGAIDWRSLARQAQWQDRWVADQRASLAALGVDLIVGDAILDRSRQGTLRVRVDDRGLWGQRYLLALPGRSTVPLWTEQTAVAAYTPDTIATLADRGVRPGERWLVTADSPITIELAQVLRQLGACVTLATPGPQVLAGLPPIAAAWLQTELESQAIEVIPQAAPHQCKVLEGQTWIQIGDRAREIDCLLTDGDYQALLPKGFERLWPRAIGAHDWPANDQLQLPLGADPHLYGCGAILGGYPLEPIAQREALLIIENSLRSPWQRPQPIGYEFQPWAIRGPLPLAVVGGGDQAGQTHELATPIGRCQIQFDRHRRLQGACLLAPGAIDAISAVAVLLGRSGTLQDLLLLPAAQSEAIDLLRQTAQQALALLPA
ncbi:MAG TPA: FAD-dependent oxidoreductase [Coleofasciculaceae cyanobacterium]